MRYHSTMPTVLDHFDALTSKGLRIIPLRINSKIPLCRGWGKDWNLAQARHKLVCHPHSNIGVLLGDIIDVEGDSPQANRIIMDLIGDCPHPAYSSSRGIHNLFLTPDKDLRIFKVGDIEFRGTGHQSVLPPSVHQGVGYKWLSNFQFPVPEMPKALYFFYMKHRYGGLKPGHIRVWCGKCGKECFLHKKRFELELQVFRILEQKWQCHSCRELDLRPLCRLARMEEYSKIQSLIGSSLE